MMLGNKVAVIYGAGGAIGGAVARAFAAEGAKVFLTGHRLSRKHDSSEAGNDARRGSERGGFRSFRQSKWVDRNDRQFDHGQLGRLVTEHPKPVYRAGHEFDPRRLSLHQLNEAQSSTHSL